MTKFSANLGFLWNDLSLPDAIRAAKAANFDAVECHWPYQYSTEEVKSALQETGLRMLGLNTSRGNVASGENGLSAVVGRELDAQAHIDEAIEYAVAIDASKIHVMAGFASNVGAHATFIANLEYACAQASVHDITILIEPLNHYDAPGYFLSTTEQAKLIIQEINTPNLKLMFDCYHVQLMEGDISHRLKSLQPIIGHIQFASVPNRGEPDMGELNYQHVFNVIAEMGYNAPLGADYKSTLKTNETLRWMKQFASS